MENETADEIQKTAANLYCSLDEGSEAVFDTFGSF